MTIIDHLSVGVSDIEQACAFYDGVLETLGINRLAANEDFAAYGQDRVQFLVMKPEDGDPYSAGNGTHICFVSPSPNAVDAFHVVAIRKGASCEGAPGPRPDYPAPNVYAAFVRDPFGNKLEAIHNGFAA